MNKTDLIQKLESVREEFLDLIEGLEGADLTTPGVCGEWSIKDILSHLSHWEAELVRLLWQVKQGQKPNTAQIVYHNAVDEINKTWAHDVKDRPFELVLDDFHAVRNQTINRVEEFSEADLINQRRSSWQNGKPLMEWIENDSFGHEIEHMQEIKAWRTKILEARSKQG